MPIRQTTPKDVIRRAIEAKLDALHTRLLMVLHKAGLEATTEAREHHRYLAQTGNLQSSVGYCIVEDGKIVETGGFTAKSGATGQGTEGAKVGMSFMERVAAERGEGLSLIVVAGMPYAVYVEAMGLNVLDSARIKARDEAKEGLRRAMRSLWQQ